MSRMISNWGRAVGLVAAGLCLLAPLWAGAAEAAGAATAAVAAPGGVPAMSFGQFFKSGGILMYPITVLSILGVMLIIYFAFVLRQEQIVPKKWLEELRGQINGGRMDQARELCDEKPSPMACIAASALDYVRTAPARDTGLLKEVIEGEGVRQATAIQNQIQYLLDIAVVAPMMGLLGTVIGMLQAFNVVALDIAKAKPMLLAAGVSLALITTVGGLIVAIPAMIAYSYFRNRASNIVARLEIASASLLTWLAK
jgi:biopolymer transport protein ExbB